MNRDRVSVSLSASGRFAPGEPIRLSSTVRGIRGTQASRVSFHASHGQTGNSKVPLERGEILAIPAGTERTNSTTLSFPEPGYYHVLASVASTSEAEQSEDRKQGVPVSPVATSSVWILVEQKGGRVDGEYDHAIRQDTSRYLSNGTLGAFRTTSLATRMDKSPRENTGLVTSLQTFPEYSGRVTRL